MVNVKCEAFQKTHDHLNIVKIFSCKITTIWKSLWMCDLFLWEL